MSSPETYEYLTSANGELLLLNCDVADNRVLAGLAYLSPGLPETITIKTPTGDQIGFIGIPGDVRRSFIPQVFSSRNDDIEFAFKRY